jgi:hypothetical protein
VTPLTAATLPGAWGAVLLPLDADDGIEWKRLADEIELLVASEFHTLDEAEFDRVSRLLAAASTGPASRSARRFRTS